MKVGLALVFVASATAVWAQAQPEVVSHDAPAIFSSRVNLVSVPVVVRDKDGKSVGSLRQQDFQLFDKGRAQEITKFTIETSAGSAATIEKTANERTETAAAAPEKPVLPQRFVAYLFDDVHMKPGDLLNARKAANQQLDRTVRDATTRAGIFTISGRTTQDFSSDGEKLHAAVNKIQPWERGLDKEQDCPAISFYMADIAINREKGLSPGYSDAQVLAFLSSGQFPVSTLLMYEIMACMHIPQPPLGSAPDAASAQQFLGRLRNATQQALAWGQEETKSSLTLMRDLIRSMSGLPGSRTIVLVGPGFLLPDENRVDENDIFERAIKASVTINSLDVRGLATLPGFDASERGDQTIMSAQAMQYEATAASLSQDLLGEVAAATGGTFFHNSNSLEEGLNELAARPEYVYVLGFSPDNLKLDGSYHGLKVKLANGAKLEVEARRGYWAPNHSVSPAEQAKEEIQDAVFSREEMLDIPVKLHTEFFKQSESKAQLTVETRIELKGLKFKKADDRNRDNLTVVTGLFDDNGRYVKGTERTIEMQLRDQTLESASNSGLAVKATFDVPLGRYVVRVVVRDAEGQSMAAQNEGVEIR